MKALRSLIARIGAPLARDEGYDSEPVLTLSSGENIIDADLGEYSSDAVMKRYVRIGMSIMLSFFLFMIFWLLFSKLQSAVMANGVVAVEGEHKTVQHADGGIVDAILVREGQFVRKGDILIKMSRLQSQAALDIQNASADSLMAAIARLQAQLSGSKKIDFPQELLDRAGDPRVAALLKDQDMLFKASTALTRGQTAQAESLMSGYRAQMAALDQQYRLAREELSGTRALYEKGYATKTRVLALERGLAAIMGQRQEYEGNLRRMENSISPFGAGAGQMTQDALVRLNTELNDAINRLSEVREHQRVLRGALERTDVRAPATGNVLGLSVFTPGAVVATGQHLLDIVPADARLSARAMLLPTDGERVKAGMRVELRLASIQGRNFPPFYGTVLQRSSDLIQDPKREGAFYSVTVKIEPPASLKHKGIDLQPGMPVEIIVPTGSRTAMQYMIEPITIAFRHGLRE